MSELMRGACICRRVSFTIAGDLAAPDACHCVQCRKQSGHYFASTNVSRTALVVSGAENVSWYQSSPNIRRGFCSTCGSFLFWDPPARDWIAVAMGAFETPTATHLAKHIFVAEKGDYYEIVDGLPQSPNH
jgi:hypothetical protein